jgi:hypothetical protein
MKNKAALPRMPVVALLGKILFSGAPPWQQRKNLKILAWTLAASFFMSCLVFGFIELQKHKF